MLDVKCGGNMIVYFRGSDRCLKEPLLLLSICRVFQCCFRYNLIQLIHEVNAIHTK